MMKKIIYLVLLLLLSGCADETNKSDEFSLHVRLQPEDVSINQGDAIWVEIMIEECTQPIFGISMQVEYDEDLLSFADSTSVMTGDFFGDNGITFAGEENGVIHLTMSLVQGDTLLDGNGTLCSLRFNAVNVGEAAINLLSEEISVYDAEGNLLEIEFLETANTIISVI
jgi:Cohesin domain